MELVVGIDVATAAVRAVAADAEGRIQAESEAPLPPPVAPRPRWSEQDASAWCPAAVGALRQLTRTLAKRAAAVGSVSVSATSGTVVALDATGRPVGPALTYADQRAVTEARVAVEADADRWADLGLRVQPSFGLPKMAWLLTQNENRRRLARLAHPSDVVVGHLIGEPAPTDYSHALKSGFDPLRMEWASGALDKLGVPVEMLPEVRAPGEPAGELCADAAEETGLPVGCQVRLGMTDGCAAQLAAGAGQPGRFVSVLGSTLVVKGTSKDLVRDPDGVVYSHRHPAGWWLPGGASSVGGRALTAAFLGTDLSKLDRQAERHGPATVSAYPLVGTGERFPFAVADAHGFTTAEPASGIDRYRALLEGVAFVERLGYERLACLGAPAAGPVAIVGGGSRSRVWGTVRATVLGRTLVQKPDASTALGAAILAATGTLHPDVGSATSAMAAAGTEIEPNPAEQERMEESFDGLRAALVERGWLGNRRAE